jgi:hypothetical protein
MLAQSKQSTSVRPNTRASLSRRGRPARAAPVARVAYEHASVAFALFLCVFVVVIRSSRLAKSVASMPAEPDVRCPAGMVLATQRHIIRAGEGLPSSHGQRQMSAVLIVELSVRPEGGTH